MKDVYITTNGCEEGQLKSMHVQHFFERNGLQITEDPAQADTVVFFACGLTDQKEKHSVQMIRQLQSVMKPSARLLVWGCLAKINPQSLTEVYTGPLIGPRDMSHFEKMLETARVPIDDVSANTLVPSERGLSIEQRINVFNGILFQLKRAAENLRFPRQVSLFDERSFFVRAAEGCTGHCTYCSERCAWGGIKSRPISRIISEYRWGLQHKYNRFFLVAGDLGSYGLDTGCTAVDLLREMIREKGKGDYSIIINQMSPGPLRRMLPDLEEVFDSGRIESLGCQVESGSNRILKLMGRTYMVEEWKECILRINSRYPDIRLATHFMVGFPTETEEDFKATLKLLDPPLFLDTIGIFKFSTRPNVYASRMPGQIPEKTKEERFRRLQRKYLYMYLLNTPIGNARNLFGILSKRGR
jgi:threonylcarbamoyladenosine tRNA methylthiotransferase MtaB